MTYMVIETQPNGKRRILRHGLTEDFANRVKNARTYINGVKGKVGREVTIERETDQRLHRPVEVTRP